LELSKYARRTTANRLIAHKRIGESSYITGFSKRLDVFPLACQYFSYAPLFNRKLSVGFINKAGNLLRWLIRFPIHSPLPPQSGLGSLIMSTIPPTCARTQAARLDTRSRHPRYMS